MLFHKKNNSALSLIEALIWLGIFAVAIAAMIMLYQQDRDSSNLSRINRELGTLHASLESSFAYEKTDDLDNKNAIGLGLVPKTLQVYSETGIKNVFNGEVTIYGIAPSGFGITYNNVPQSMCGTLLKEQYKVGWNTASNGKDTIVFTNGYSNKEVADICNSSKSINITFEHTQAK